jgi:hypothetical protein
MGKRRREMNTNRLAIAEASAERMKTTDEDVLRYDPEYHNEVIMSFIAAKFGLNVDNYLDNNGIYKIPTMVFNNDTQFVFENIREVYSFRPFDAPDKESLMVVNDKGTLFPDDNLGWYPVPYFMIFGDREDYEWLNKVDT